MKKKKPPQAPPRSLPKPLRREGSPYWMKKPPQAPPKGGDVFPQRSLPQPLRKEGSFLSAIFR